MKPLPGKRLGAPGRRQAEVFRESSAHHGLKKNGNCRIKTDILSCEGWRQYLYLGCTYTLSPHGELAVEAANTGPSCHARVRVHGHSGYRRPLVSHRNPGASHAGARVAELGSGRRTASRN